MEEVPFRPQGYNMYYMALDILKLSDDITLEDHTLIRSMLDSEDEENLAMAELILWDKYKDVIIKIKES